MESVANAIGVPRSTLAVMTTFRLSRKPVTNTANLEAVCRFFCQRLSDFRLEDLVEFSPPLEGTVTTKVDELYPERAARSPRRHRVGPG
jgi:hypothetical protein